MLVFFFSLRGQNAEKRAESRPLGVGMAFSRPLDCLISTTVVMVRLDRPARLGIPAPRKG
jgi:hypothetical protein